MKRILTITILSLSLVFSMVCVTSAADISDYPPPDPFTVLTADVRADYPYYFIYWNTGTYYLYASPTPWYLIIGSSASTIENNESSTAQYQYVSWSSTVSDSWSDPYYGQNTIKIGMYRYDSTAGNKFIASNQALEYPTYPGYEDFFLIPPTLAETILAVTGETLETETVPTMAASLGSLTVCGIGCLALLIVLKIFGRRSLISRG